MGWFFMHHKRPKGFINGQKSRGRHWWREAATIVRDSITARPRKEWPDDGFQIEDFGVTEEGEAPDTMEREREYYYGRGESWEPAEVVKAETPGRDGVPTVDDDLDNDVHAAPRSYPSWTDDNSFIVWGLVGPVEGARWRTRAEGRKWVKQKYGFIYEETNLPSRVYFRVPKPRS